MYMIDITYRKVTRTSNTNDNCFYKRIFITLGSTPCTREIETFTFYLPYPIVPQSTKATTAHHTVMIFLQISPKMFSFVNYYKYYTQNKDNQYKTLLNNTL